MRGKAAETLTDSGWIGITPAYAGKSVQLRQCQGSSRDHPRLCGEKRGTFFQSRISSGSPPPMRGKDFSMAWNNIKIGITPAYAGKR